MKLFRLELFAPGLLLLGLVLGLVACDSATPTIAGSASVSGPTASFTTIGTSAAVATVASSTAVALAASTVAAIPTVTTGTTSAVGNGAGLTMKEAYTLADPQLKSWQPDQYLFSIFNSLDSGIGIDADGRSAEWNFQAISAKAGKRDTWRVKSGGAAPPTVAKTGDEEVSEAEVKASPALPPVSNLIDSSQLMNVARQNGGDKSDSPVGFFLRQPVKPGDPLAVDLVFYKGNAATSLRIDMQTGKVVPNVRG